MTGKGMETVSDFECGFFSKCQECSAVNDAYPHKSSEADAELSKPEMNANAHAPLPLPSGNLHLQLHLLVLHHPSS
ncbi:hypothetical protein EJD97_018410 [Solanum chilense]|uniref:Uncharacterized protein n=2 Tax=Solanum subgen. Lycopersicon TaxID=49274 RepID=K4CFI4_SOLLC|nr:hypothetical protein EJD97_018410 [Solanum chilense]